MCGAHLARQDGMRSVRPLLVLAFLVLTQRSWAEEGAKPLTEAKVRAYAGDDAAEMFAAERYDVARYFPGAERHFDEVFRASMEARLGPPDGEQTVPHFLKDE